MVLTFVYKLRILILFLPSSPSPLPIQTIIFSSVKDYILVKYKSLSYTFLNSDIISQLSNKSYLIFRNRHLMKIDLLSFEKHSQSAISLN
jgi:hypothetical protein